MNRKRAGPVSSTHRERTRCRSRGSRRSAAGSPRAEPSRIATVSGFPSDWLRWMFSITTVALSTSSPMASARPPSVIRLIDWPVMEQAGDAGEDRQRDRERRRSRVLRQLPRNSRIISETRIDEIIASRTTFSTAARTNTDWSKSSFSSSPCGAEAWISGSRSLVASTTVRVEASECLQDRHEDGALCR